MLTHERLRLILSVWTFWISQVLEAIPNNSKRLLYISNKIQSGPFAKVIHGFLSEPICALSATKVGIILMRTKKKEEKRGFPPQILVATEIRELYEARDNYEEVK